MWPTSRWSLGGSIALKTAVLFQCAEPSCVILIHEIDIIEVRKGLEDLEGYKTDRAAWP